ncbi:diguanylate cyclase/phosphodiesterase (GGDEF & EAL domains) with PAS/PAC sensor(s) [hydrothermal vent metagenome]|uniref:Diguanylate cyclase/phosphodiesterase (GGDEF & EAL domains) with PAS/PAC sensor(S) n=1 Tax=hydrothermal vent metagenome TaxID=652676 RepID=A0A1W1D226_9ZZZZ
MVKKYEYILLFIAVSLLALFLFLYNRIDDVEKMIFSQIKTKHMEHINTTLQYIAEDILIIKNKKQNLFEVFQEKKIRNQYEKKLQVLISKNIRYAYILKKDKKGKYRFLLDGSHEDKAHFYQKFDPMYPKLYDKVYKTHQPQLIKQDNIQNLWITYLYPIVSHNKTIALVSIDTTTHLAYSIHQLIQPIKKIFLLLILFVILLFLLGIINMFYSVQIQKKLFIDPLTKLYNRRYLEEIETKLSLSKYTVAMFDIDHFKNINDTYGHKAGDYILQECAKIFEQNTRESDIVIRYGGEEFLMLINTRKNNKNTAYMVLERIREAIESYYFTYDNTTIQCTISIGVHPQPQQEKNLTNAIKIADQMLYVAKENGRNQIQIYDDKNQAKTFDIDITRDAIAQHRVVLEYQAIYDPYQQKTIKYEALVRIKKQDGSLIYPNDFIPPLKHTNVAFRLTKEILTLNFDFFAHRKDAVSINLSASDIMNNDIITFIENKLQTNKDLASRITFEVLESEEITQIQKFQQQLKRLQNLGCEIAIDDFGSGFANFKMVLDIQANILKIDASLIKDIHTNEKVYRVVKNIILFAKDVHMKTVAEFVASKEIYDILVELGIDYMQGFYIAKPTSLKE